jgi:hypothetical protein
METLKLKCIVKDAIYYKVFTAKADGMIYDKKTGSLLGRNIAEVVEYMKNPLNESVLMEVTKTVEKYWNN